MSAKDLTVKRRTAKAKLTRKEKAVDLQLSENRPPQEVKEVFEEFREAFVELTAVHEQYSATIENDDDFFQQEEWMDQCQEAFLKLKIRVTDYSVKNEGGDTRESEETQDLGVSASASPSQERPSIVKIEKARLPKFSGDVRDYYIFRGDFIHMTEGRYSKRDMISLLRSCLHGKPQEMIRGIGEDFDAALEYLDSVYGDPRFIADAIVNDINSFKALRSGEDSRFATLCI